MKEPLKGNEINPGTRMKSLPWGNEIALKWMLTKMKYQMKDLP